MKFEATFSLDFLSSLPIFQWKAAAATIGEKEDGETVTAMKEGVEETMRQEEAVGEVMAVPGVVVVEGPSTTVNNHRRSSVITSGAVRGDLLHGAVGPTERGCPQRPPLHLQP